MVSGEQVIDIRDFDIASPTVLMLRIYPDVLVQLQVEAEALAAGGRGLMGILLAFAAGYVLGARGGSEDFDDVVQAVQAIRQSEEFD